VVVEGVGSVPNFSALQDGLATGRTDRLVFYAFDLLYLDGYDLRPSPLIARKTALAALVVAPSIVRYSEHFEEDGNHLFQHACRLGLKA
jgi:bifunctional non-homologous end joining protein LigD